MKVKVMKCDPITQQPIKEQIMDKAVFERIMSFKSLAKSYPHPPKVLDEPKAESKQVVDESEPRPSRRSRKEQE